MSWRVSGSQDLYYPRNMKSNWNMDNSSDSNAIILGGESLRDAETKMIYRGLVNGSSHRSKRVGGAAVPETVVLLLPSGAA